MIGEWMFYYVVTALLPCAELEQYGQTILASFLRWAS